VSAASGIHETRRAVAHLLKYHGNPQYRPVINSAKLTNSFAGMARLNNCLIFVARTDKGDQMLAVANPLRIVWLQLSAQALQL